MKAESNPRLQGLMTCEEMSWFKYQGCLIFCLVGAKKPSLEHTHLQGLKSIPKIFNWKYQKATACECLTHRFSSLLLCHKEACAEERKMSSGASRKMPSGIKRCLPGS